MENLEDYYNYDSNSCTELNLTEHWTNLPLEKEVSRGVLLRDQKLRQNVYQKHYDELNIDFNVPSTSGTNYCHQLNKRTSGKKSRKIKKKKSPVRCPLRIAELAVPTKRQCIETWRNKAGFLPNFMVDRLKQRVMDEKPIVHITDAINCFKRKTKLKKRSGKTPRSTVKNKRKGEIQMLCAIFGFKITLKLLRPLSISLNSRLERINNIVTEEILALLRRKNLSRQKQVKNSEVLLDQIAPKITLWIANILQETDYRVLEEDLRELEEEEGPVLDFIDDLLDAVVRLCEPPRNTFSEKLDKQSETVSILSFLRSVEDIISDRTEVNIKHLLEDVDLEAFNGAGQHYDPLLNKEMLSIEEKIEPSIRSEDSLQKGSVEFYVDNGNEFTLENVRERSKIIVHQILNNIIVEKIVNKITTGESRPQDKEDRFNDIETYFISEQNNLILNENIEGEKNIVVDEIENTHVNTTNTQFEYDNKKNDKSLDSYSETHENNNSIAVGVNDIVESLELKSEIDTAENDHILDAFESAVLHNSGIAEEQSNQGSIQNNFPSESHNIKLADSDQIQSQDKLQTENNLEDIKDNIKHESISGYNGGNEEADSDMLFMDAVNTDLRLSPKDSSQKQINEGGLDSVMENSDTESVDDDDELNEEKDKKVKFSDTNMDNTIKKNLLGKGSNQGLMQIPSGDNKLNINLAPPNKSLLFDVDESWPKDVQIPTLKATVSVNKSVVSLGNILEADEKKEISSEISYNFRDNSEVLIDVLPYPSMSIDETENKDISIGSYQKQEQIIIGKKLSESIRVSGIPLTKNRNLSESAVDAEKLKTYKINNKRPRANVKDANNQRDVKTINEINIIKYDNKPRDVLKNSMNNRTISKEKNVSRKIDSKNYNTFDKIDKSRNDTKKENKLKETSVTKKEVNKKYTKTVVMTNEKHEKHIKKSKERIVFLTTVKKTKRVAKPIVEAISKNAIRNDNKNDQKSTSYSSANFLQNEQRKKYHTPQIKKQGIDTIHDYDIQKWREGLENVIENLEMWNVWIYSICKSIKYLKGNTINSRTSENTKRKWRKLHKNIKQDRILWKDMKRRNEDGLKSYKMYYNYIKYGETNFKIVCDCNET